MTKTWEPVAAGTIDIVDGTLSLLGSIVVIIGIMFFVPVFGSIGPGPVPEFGRWLIHGFIETLLWLVTVFLIIVGILPIVGGVYALQRKKWGLALAGSIAAILGSAPLGIAATVLTVLAKDEFE